MATSHGILFSISSPLEMATGRETTKSTSEVLVNLSFDELRKITNNFSEDRKLGGSQFGTLYKGIMGDGKEILVKKLENYNEISPDKTFQNEVEKIRALKNENLVEVVGFCSEVQEQLVPSGETYVTVDITANFLCYQYFPNGNLDVYLFGTKPSKDFSVDPGTKANDEFSSAEQGSQAADDISSEEAGTSKTTDEISSDEPNTKVAENISSSEQGIQKVSLDISSSEPETSKAAEDFSLSEPSIDWDTRFKIINGICHGLLFLHSLDRPIIHMDLKLQNIWLGAKMEPKIGNFGLSRLFGTDLSRMYTKTVVGTYGHMAPEYLFRGEISIKTDIYSLGLMIIQITTREKNYPDPTDLSARKYVTEIRTGWTAEHIASKYSSLDAERLQQVYACIEIGLECVLLDRTKRPPVAEIVDRLNTI